MLSFNKEKNKSSGLSDFVRNASSNDKNKIYGTAIKNAILSQQRVIEKSKSAA